MSAPPEFDGCHAIEQLESGPITDLYAGVQQPLGRSVLIKALSPSLLPSSPFATALEREARLLSKLEHPNIPRIYDFRRDSERMWLVLEHVAGYSLREILDRQPKLSERAATSVALEITRALVHAHRRGIVHHDLRPRNVRVSSSGQVKLVNFSPITGERPPEAWELVGARAASEHHAYSSPEQILGEYADARSDLFSLGVVIYLMLAGEAPFAGENAEGMSQRIRHEPPPPLGRKVPGIQPALERTVLRCLEKLASDRFASAEELEQALELAHREQGGGDTRAPILAELARAGLIDGIPAPTTAKQRPLAGPRSIALGRGVVGLALASVSIAIGGALLRPAPPSTQERGAETLPLVPARAGYLRVVAEPWADVFVDGAKVETTPFARPIPLEAGTHHIRLEHPAAPSERRTVRLAPGETLLLDVAMKVPPLPAKPAPERDANTTQAEDDSP